jgi:hypothetical protein
MLFLPIPLLPIPPNLMPVNICFGKTILEIDDVARRQGRLMAEVPKLRLLFNSPKLGESVRLAGGAKS